MNRHAWWLLSGLLAAGALIGGTQPSEPWDWQPQLALQQPWRAWTAAFVHWSPLHLGANLLGTLGVAALGVAAGCRGRSAVAWVLAWPATQFALVLQPELLHYGGLSGVLHAGVTIAALQLIFSGAPRSRRIGVMLALGLAVKLWLEAPWGAPLRQVDGWDIAIAPLAHATGVLAGAVFGAAMLRHWRRPSSAP